VNYLDLKLLGLDAIRFEVTDIYGDIDIHGEVSLKNNLAEMRPLDYTFLFTYH